MLKLRPLSHVIRWSVERHAPALKPSLVFVVVGAQKLFWRITRRRRSWKGYCPICEERTRFVALGTNFDEYLTCRACGSIPRERALMRVLATLYPDWRALRIHESSPGSGGASLKLKSECADYVATQYVPDCEPGSEWNGCRIEDLARQTFPDASFDIVVTQQVFEHLFEPGEAIAEIARTLRPGGAHLMTVPIVHRHRGSERRAALADGEVIYLREPQYHDNPVGSGSLVTVDWGLDIADYLAEKSGCLTSIYMIDDRSQGIIGKQIEVVVTRKPAVRRSI